MTVVYTVTSNAGTPAGQVFVTTDGPETCTSTVAAGQCLLTLTVPGARTLTVTYEGNVSFDSSSATTPHQVDPAPTTTTIVSDEPDPSYVGQPVIVSYTVTSSGGTPTGDVTVTASGGAGTCTGTVAAGQCSLTIVGPGERTITASYAGNASFAASSDTDEHQVDPTPTTTTILSDEPDPSFVGQAITVAYSVTAPVGTPIGNVTVSGGTGPESCIATVEDGQCSLILVTPGLRTLTASYPGTLTFAPSTASVATHPVNPAITFTTITGDTPDPSPVGGSVEVTWTVLVQPPAVVAPASNVTVTISGGSETCSAPASAGGCSLTPTLLGGRTVIATYSGDAQTVTSLDHRTAPGRRGDFDHDDRVAHSRSVANRRGHHGRFRSQLRVGCAPRLGDRRRRNRRLLHECATRRRRQLFVRAVRSGHLAPHRELLGGCADRGERRHSQPLGGSRGHRSRSPRHRSRTLGRRGSRLRSPSASPSNLPAPERPPAS